MSNTLKPSRTVRLILAKSKIYKDDFGSASVSVLHALLAILDIYLFLDDYDAQEILDCIDLLGVEQQQLKDFHTILSDYLHENTTITYEENYDLTQVLNLAKLFAEYENSPTLTAPYLMKEIMSDPAGIIAFLKKKITETNTSFSDESNEFFDEDLPFSNTKTDSADSESIKENDMEETPSIEDDFEIKYEDATLSDFVKKASDLQSYLLDHIFGQDEVVSAFVSGYFNSIVRSFTGRSDNRPAATFLFAGAPGVGKTYLAECAAKQLGLPFKRFDMSGFSDKEAPLSFAGCNKVFKSAHAGLVTDFVEKNPTCILLFDEIEKAHTSIIHLFLQMLDAGHLQDMYTERMVSFKNAIIIMTTNVGRALYENNDDQFSKTAISRKVIINALANEKDPETDAPYFPTAICSRFASGNILLFNPLSALDLICIARKRLSEFCTTFSSNQKIDINIDKHIGPALLFSEGGKVDARSLKGRADTFISSEVFKWLKFAYAKDPEKFANLLAIKIEIDLENGGEATWLFEEKENTNVLLFSERENIFNCILDCEGYNFFLASNADQTKEIVAKNNIDFIICDIIRDRDEKNLNIEDTTSTGRKLFDFFVQEDIPFYILTEHKLQINIEERQALLEQKAHGFFDCYPLIDIEERLKDIMYQVSCEKKLIQLGRANKVLTFDCTYEWEDDELGLILVKNLRVSPAIEAEDKKDIAPIDVSNVTFEQIIGAEDAKDELKSFISFLRNPKEYARHSIPAPKGILLYGPPGTGKTMLAKALAKESGAAFIASEGNMFIKSTYGQASDSVHAIFKKARKYAPCILFIDEIDVIAMDRISNNSSPSANEALNALLNEMDGFSANPNKPVFVLAATNFDISFDQKSALDAALLRRFDRRIFVDLPDRNERKRFIKERLMRSHQELDDDILDNFSIRSIGMSLAELGLIIDFALRSMLRVGESVLTVDRFNQAFETFCHGEEKENNEITAKRIALHEAGHAFISWHFGKKPSYITISGRSNFGGYMKTENSDSIFHTARDLKSIICTSLAGRAAEVVFFGSEDGISTGAANDLKKASEIALEMITKLGMSEKHGLLTLTANTPDSNTIKLCNDILDEQFDIAVKLITKNKEKISRLAETLVDKNHLIGSDVDEIFKN